MLKCGISLCCCGRLSVPLSTSLGWQRENLWEGDAGNRSQELNKQLYSCLVSLFWLSRPEFCPGATGTGYIPPDILLVSWGWKLFPCHPSRPFLPGQPSWWTEVLGKRTATKCLTGVKWLRAPSRKVSCLVSSSNHVAYVTHWKYQVKRGKESKMGGKMCWGLKIVYVNMPYCLLKGKGGSASLTSSGWCLKVWEWTTVVTN